jgi:peptide/nickel transport system permease protein
LNRYLLRRLAFVGLTVLFTSMLIFGITRLLPGDVAGIILGREAGEAARAQLRVELGLDDPPPVQYARWLGAFVRGDWGQSYSSNEPVREVVLPRLRNSLMLAAVTLVMAVPLALGLGVLAGLRAGSWLDGLISVAALGVVGLPEFVTGVVLIELLAFRLRLLPANSTIRLEAPFLEALPMLILPALTATLVLLAYITRLVRAGVVEELEQPYVRTARLKGLAPAAVVLRHVLRNALLPAITVIAISFGWLMGGLVVVENVFNYPGLGRLLVFAIDRRDLPLLQAITLLSVLAYAGANLLADWLYTWLDPRLRLG